MDGVKRYTVELKQTTYPERLKAEVVLASDFDAAISVGAAALAREAALRSENERLELLVKDFQWGSSVEAQAGDEARTELAALREELAEAQRVLSFSGNEADAHSTAALHTELEDTHERLTAAEQRNEFLEAQVSAKDIGIDFRDAMINSVRMSTEPLMAWVPSDWEAKRALLLVNVKPTESGASNEQ